MLSVVAGLTVGVLLPGTGDAPEGGGGVVTAIEQEAFVADIAEKSTYLREQVDAGAVPPEEAVDELAIYISNKSRQLSDTDLTDSNIQTIQTISQSIIDAEPEAAIEIRVDILIGRLIEELLREGE